ncbi:hypothetical protein E2C01_018599 [Portunus trituberculatus]|uniref:Uncharacterized protein n=1 Tax=Portunus trituberculatus TaxID=210409 RepID=A0A5B7DUX7_PORTR|nr:hypothetical protein [Portunus trituberculatus]
MVTLVYTPGRLVRPQAMPHDTRPTKLTFPSLFTVIGPPESPCNVRSSRVRRALYEEQTPSWKRLAQQRCEGKPD